MYSILQLIPKYTGYLLRARGRKGHGIHSPFVYAFVTRVLYAPVNKAAAAPIEQLRRDLRRDTTVIPVTDFGAGPAGGATRKRTVAQIARTAAKPAKYAGLLYRIAAFYRPRTVLELGTSLGLTTAYLAAAAPDAAVTTLEGSPELAAIAARNFARLQLSRIRVVPGHFDHTLLSVLEEMKQVDIAFVDGNHRQEPTIRYFELLLLHTHPDSILVFDDIHWSSEMEAAWSVIRNDPRVTCSIDLFFMGIVFFRKEFKEKLHFTIPF
jgi:predicted O-methyltransferase YrrM